MKATVTAAVAGMIDVGGDLTAARLGYGAMRITGPGVWGEPPDRDRARAAPRRAVDLGVTFIDTADAYGPEVSERLIARDAVPVSEELVIAIKGGLVRPGPGGGYRTAGPSTCAILAGAAWPGCGSTGSTCTSSTGTSPKTSSGRRSG